jgi:hypothetical protein
MKPINEMTKGELRDVLTDINFTQAYRAQVVFRFEEICHAEALANFERAIREARGDV